MKIIRGCLVFAAVLFVAFGAAFAQQGPKPPTPPSAEEIVGRMKTELGLSDEQVNQITPVIQEESSQMQAMMGDGAPPEPGQANEKMEQLRRDTESKLAQYLTEEQLAQWKSRRKGPAQADSGEIGPSGDGGRDGGGREHLSGAEQG